MRGFGAKPEWPHRPLNQLFDLTQIGPFLVTAEGDCRPRRTGACGSTDPVDIIFRHVGQLEIDNVRHAFHIDPARGDVCGH
jgi:hypothetical protein